jgi:hypothetical protein
LAPKSIGLTPLRGEHFVIVIYLAYAGSEIFRVSTLFAARLPALMRSANTGNFFPQKLGTIFFVTNNSKIFKNKIKKVNHFIYIGNFLLLGW